MRWHLVSLRRFNLRLASPGVCTFWLGVGLGRRMEWYHAPLPRGSCFSSACQ